MLGLSWKQIAGVALVSIVANYAVSRFMQP